MLRLISYGLLAALFFSSTFVFNRAMSLGGGHWVWSAALRYGYALLLISLGFLLTGRARTLVEVGRVYLRHWLFWTLAGCIGFGVFYSGITFAASFAPGWVVATTWQTTILATPLVLAAFGKRVPLRGLLFTLLIFAGVLLVNLEHAAQTTWAQVALGALPVLIAAVAYPVGLQMVWEARAGVGDKARTGRVPRIDSPVVDQPFARVLLLILGSLPFWIVLVLVVQPPPPTQGQWVSTLLVALSSGIVATVLFMHARHLAHTPYQLDSTQSGEVIFSLLGEVLLLGGALPGIMGWAGVALTLIGLVLYLSAQRRGVAA
jgi:drug/metabolite transporter (DMT)-like permease